MQEDLKKIIETNHIDFNRLDGKTLLVTGATGLIGSTLIKAILGIAHIKGFDIKLIAHIRNRDKFNKIFSESEKERIEVIESEIQELDVKSYDIDYIVHGASATASSYFVDHPAECIEIAVNGTKKVLEIARKNDIEAMVFLSTMEVYGYPDRGHTVSESEIGGLDTMVVRNCYPISKQLCENMCASYANEYNVPVRVARLTQTFGPGVDYSDQRVFAQFARCAVEKKNIVLKTKGETCRCYLYTLDAVAAIFAILLNGENKEAYTVANSDTYCSIYEMAKLVADEYGIDVVIDEQDISQCGYANTLYMNLDTTKINKIGFIPTCDLKTMYKKMIDAFGE